jgi:DNA-binding NarL/FixJ family response regulator
VVVADRHAGVRHSMCAVLEREADVVVVAQTGDLDAALGAVERAPADVLVLGGGFGFRGRIAAIEAVSRRIPPAHVVFATMHDNTAFADAALAAGALGYVSKDLSDTELAPAVRAAAGGLTYISPRVSAAARTPH